MTFFTEVSVPKSTIQLTHQSRIFMLGSCFSDYMAQRMQRAGFSANLSPLGILFNPASIIRALERYMNCQKTDEREIYHAAEGYFSLDAHSCISRPQKEEAIEAFNQAVEEGHRLLNEADTLIITLGTAWIYRHRATGEPVANCHRLPKDDFSRELLTPEQISGPLVRLLGQLSAKRVIFTLSPVRHLADGAAENSLSKAILRVAISQITSQTESAEYFPSFEIMTDELRDYRFYSQDMTHPSPLAVEHIWQKFLTSHSSEKTRQTALAAEQIKRAMEHRPFSPQSPEYREFCLSELHKVKELQKSGVDLRKEEAFFEGHLLKKE